MTTKKPAIINDPEYLPDKVPRIALSKVGHVRSELASVYRQARNGKVDLSDATKLAYILVAIGRLITDHELEKRIEALEDRNDES
ncbi:MAG: hypothetical protein K0A93_08820 [Desulfuromonadaceae bacterium]|nr:hypothetical protein [Desulfuromonadaceae bacterium]